MRGPLAAVARLTILTAIAGLAIYAAYINVNDELSFPDETKQRFILTWSALPAAALLVYVMTALVSRKPALSFRPVLSLLTVYALVYSFYAFTGLVDARQGGRTQFMFIPIILGVFSLPFFLFMVDRIVSIVRGNFSKQKSADRPES